MVFAKRKERLDERIIIVLNTGARRIFYGAHCRGKAHNLGRTLNA